MKYSLAIYISRFNTCLILNSHIFNSNMTRLLLFELESCVVLIFSLFTFIIRLFRREPRFGKFIYDGSGIFVLFKFLRGEESTNLLLFTVLSYAIRRWLLCKSRWDMINNTHIRYAPWVDRFHSQVVAWLNSTRKNIFLCFSNDFLASSTNLHVTKKWSEAANQREVIRTAWEVDVKLFMSLNSVHLKIISFRLMSLCLLSFLSKSIFVFVCSDFHSFVCRISTFLRPAPSSFVSYVRFEPSFAHMERIWWRCECTHKRWSCP